MERDYDRGSKGIVGHFVSNIWASRRGLLLEEELCTIKYCLSPIHLCFFLAVIMSEQSFQPHEWQVHLI